jgi:hypothetical protein
MIINQLLSSVTILSDPVINAEGKELGNIKELMLNPESGQIDYAVLSFGGFLGIGDKFFAIPWDAIELFRHDKSMRLNISKEKLESMKGFDKDHWPDFANPEFKKNLYRHFDGVGNFPRSS